jgi:hypothetical protein
MGDEHKGFTKLRANHFQVLGGTQPPSTGASFTGCVPSKFVSSKSLLETNDFGALLSLLKN